MLNFQVGGKGLQFRLMLKRPNSSTQMKFYLTPHTFIHHADTGDCLSLRQSRQAAVEDEHIVVRGSDHGRTMTQEVMNALAHRPL